MARVTLQTVADAVGVSRTTVSNAYAHPEKLSPALREQITAAARRLGYQGPSAVASSLRTGRTRILGVLFTDTLRYAFTDPVATRFLAGVAGRAEDAGYGVTVVSAPRGGDAGPVRTAIVDGLVAYSVSDDSSALPVVQARGLPVVSVDGAVLPGSDAVQVADREGAAAAMGHLLELGHRRVAVLGVALGPERVALVPPGVTSANHVVRERMAGWSQACRTGGGPDPSTVSCPVNAAGHGRQAVQVLFGEAGAPAPTAIACLSDELAAGVLAGLAARGLRVPQDVSVVGFDDTPTAAGTAPALTTVRQPLLAKGDLAARLLLGRLERGPGGAPTHHQLPTRLVVRASTAPPPPDRPT